MRSGPWQRRQWFLAVFVAITLPLVSACDDGGSGTPAPDVLADGSGAAPDVESDASAPTPDVPASLPDIAVDVAAADVAPVADVPEDVAAPSPWADLTSESPTVRRMLGVSTHMKQSAGENAHRDFEFERYRELGGIRIREDYHWRRIEPAQDEWHFEAVETQVEMAREAGVEILPMLAYGVDWAMNESEESTIDPADYADFAGHLAAHFCDDLKTYELWNEPNIDRFWSPEPDPEHYGRLLIQASAAIREACPDAKISTAGFSSYYVGRFYDRWWFMEEMLAAHPGICDAFDIVSIHPYTFLQKPPPENDLVYSDELVMESQSWMTQKMRDLLAANGCGDKPIWYTEAGWPSYEISEENQGRYLARSVLLAARDRIETYFWYTFWDSTPITDGIRPHEHYFGLFGYRGEDGTVRREKPSYRAFKGIADVLGDYRFARDLSPALGLPNDVYALAFVGEDGRRGVALWDGRDVPDRWPDWVDEGGPDTTHTLSLPLPEGATGLQLFDIEGAPLTAPEGAGPHEFTLTPSPIYLLFEVQ